MLAAVLTLAACGGDEAGPTEPGLPPTVAENLAAQSEGIADKLDAGETCAAARQADALKDEAQAAIDGGQVPAALQGELMSNIDELVNTVNCPAPPPPPPAEDCEALEDEKKALEEQKDEAKGDEKHELDEQIKALDEQIKACKEGEGGENG